LNANCKSSQHTNTRSNKKHAECFFKTNLRTNSAEVKQYPESLSPNGKAQALVKNAAEQQKHQQSLALEDKAYMLTNKANAERKQRKCLTPDNKL
jgi:hypothetical protein